MKAVFTLFLIVFLSASLRAEYNGYHITFSMGTMKGERLTGYAYVASAYLNMDSLTNTGYLIKALDQSWKEWHERDSLVYFKERITYEYQMTGDEDGGKIPVYTLSDRQTIPSHEIKTITIIELMDYPYHIGISSPLSISDTAWINNPPLSSHAFGAYLCHHQIFVHGNSKKTETIIQRLQARQEELEEVEIGHENGDELDKEFWEMIQELHGEKVVVITECTC